MCKQGRKNGNYCLEARPLLRLCVPTVSHQCITVKKCQVINLLDLKF